MFKYIFKKIWGKTEEPKTEDLKTEEPKIEEPKIEEPKTEDLKTEDLKTEELKTEEPKTEDSNTEDSKTEELKTENLKTEEPKIEEPKAEDSKTEELKTEDLKTEDLKTEDLKTEDLKTEEPNTEDTGVLITTEDAAILNDDESIEADISTLKTNDALMNLFYNYNTEIDLIELLTKASEQSILYTLKIIAHIRKTKYNGNGNFYRKTCDWLFHNHENQLILNMLFFLEISKTSNWDDFSHLPSDSKSFKCYVNILSKKIKIDLDNMNNNVESISQMADWIQHDKNMLSYVAKELGINVKTLKKDYLKPLTKNLSLENNVNGESSALEKSEQIVSFNLSHHEIMMTALSDPCYDDVKCNEYSLGTNA
jgi:hypothetical protein